MSTFNPGDLVRVLPPFDADFPDVQTVETSYLIEGDGATIEQCQLVGVEPHFAARHLEHA